jgi:hypothetical protein
MIALVTDPDWRHGLRQDQHTGKVQPLQHPAAGLLPGQRRPQGRVRAEAVGDAAAEPTRLPDDAAPTGPSRGNATS